MEGFSNVLELTKFATYLQIAHFQHAQLSSILCYVFPNILMEEVKQLLITKHIYRVKKRESKRLRLRLVVPFVFVLWWQTPMPQRQCHIMLFTEHNFGLSHHYRGHVS